MTIQPKTIEEYGKPFVVLSSKQPLTDAAQWLETTDYSENELYLIIQRTDNQFQVTLFADLVPVLRNMGPTVQLGQIPTTLIPLATEVHSVDTAESGLKVWKRIKRRPDSTCVIVDQNKVIGLFAYTPRSAGVSFSIVDNFLSFFSLHGELVKFNKNSTGNAKIDYPPTCPHCSYQGVYVSSDDGQKLVCQACGHEIEVNEP